VICAKCNIWLYGCSVRETAARILGIVTMALSADSASTLLGQLSRIEPGDKATKFESREGHLAGAGYVLAQALTGEATLYSHLVTKQSNTVMHDLSRGYLALRHVHKAGMSGMQGFLQYRSRLWHLQPRACAPSLWMPKAIMQPQQLWLWVTLACRLCCPCLLNMGVNHAPCMQYREWLV
jgi:hypothetical protein